MKKIVLASNNSKKIKEIKDILNGLEYEVYSLNDMDRLLEIKDYISEGLNIAAIKKKYAEREAKSKKPRLLKFIHI